jgi:protein transport protein SEC24
MADYSMYHALGDQVSHDPNNPHAQQPNAQQFRPSPAPGPAGYQQAGSSYGAAQAQAPYGTSPQPGYQQQSPYQGGQEHGGYYGGQQSPPQQEGMGGLAQQMGGMALGGAADGSGTVRKKKRDRHAHHEIQNTGSSQAFNGMPPQGAGQIPYGGPSPAGAQAQGQFPAPANAQFTPGQAATPVEHAARGTAVTSAQGRVDPEQIPSVPTSRDGPLQHYLENVFATMDNHIAPPATIPFVAFDQGNSSPKFARLTMTHIPHSTEVLNSLAVPLGLVLQPLAPLSDGERPIPVVDFGETGPPRCRRCRAYINPFMTFRGGGNKFICNMCTFPNDTPQEYFAPTDPTGVRVDRAQRPELMLGTVDFVVPKEYWTKPPVPLNILFLIDVTEESVNKGFLAGFCDGIMNALYSGQNDADEDANEREDGESTTPSTPRLAKGAKIGIVAFDKQMHFFNLSPSLEQAQMLVMPDIEDPFVPLSSGLFVDPQESKVVITQLLTQLPAMFNPDLHSGLKNPEPALLPALEAAASALKATGGKIVCSLAALPTWGKGRLFLRDDTSAVAGTDAEKKLLTTEHAGYIKLANDLVADGTGVDFFLAAPSGGYLDIATIGVYIHRPNQTHSLLVVEALTRNARSHLLQIRRRSLLLPELPFPAGRTPPLPRTQARRYARNRFSSAHESAMLQRPASLGLPRQLHAPHVRGRPRVRRHRRR